MMLVPFFFLQTAVGGRTKKDFKLRSDSWEKYGRRWEEAFKYERCKSGTEEYEEIKFKKGMSMDFQDAINDAEETPDGHQDIYSGKSPEVYLKFKRKAGASREEAYYNAQSFAASQWKNSKTGHRETINKYSRFACAIAIYEAEKGSDGYYEQGAEDEFRVWCIFGKEHSDRETEDENRSCPEKPNEKDLEDEKKRQFGQQETAEVTERLRAEEKDLKKLRESYAGQSRKQKIKSRGRGRSYYALGDGIILFGDQEDEKNGNTCEYTFSAQNQWSQCNSCEAKEMQTRRISEKTEEKTAECKNLKSQSLCFEAGEFLTEMGEFCAITCTENYVSNEDECKEELKRPCNLSDQCLVSEDNFSFRTSGKKSGAAPHSTLLLWTILVAFGICTV